MNTALAQRIRNRLAQWSPFRAIGRRNADLQKRIPSGASHCRAAGSDRSGRSLWTGADVFGRAAAWADDPVEQVRHYRHWVYAAIRAIAHRVAATPLRIYHRLPDGSEEELRDPRHPVSRLFNYVNPFHTRYWLWSQTITFLQLTGNAYWYAPRNGLGAPAELWVAGAQAMRVVPDKVRFIAGYEYRSPDGDTLRFAPDEIVHLKLPNPANLYYGRGPLQAAAETVDTHESMKTTQLRMMRRGAFPGGAIETDASLTPEQQERLRAQFESQYAGSDNSGRWLVLEGGIEAKPLTLTPQEMAFVESTAAQRDEILAMFGVPAAVLGLSRDVNKAVAEAMDIIFARYTVAPLLQLIEDQVNQDLLPRFDDRLFVRFANPVLLDAESRRRETREDYRAGLLTLAEARAENGREAVGTGRSEARKE